MSVVVAAKGVCSRLVPVSRATPLPAQPHGRQRDRSPEGPATCGQGHCGSNRESARQMGGCSAHEGTTHLIWAIPVEASEPKGEGITIKRITRDKTIAPNVRYSTYLDENSPLRRPAIEVEQGESVVETINGPCPIIRTPDDVNPAEYQEREETGPIFVKGIEAGDVLAIRIEKITPVGHALGSYRDAGTNTFLRLQDGKVHLPGGLNVPQHMMIGDICVVPDYPIGGNPWDQGGNMDFRDICAGNTLYLRACLPGGLLILGDVHACQGDGELAGVGAECAGDVQVSITRDEIYLPERPLIRKPHSFVCIVSRQDYALARDMALQDAAKILARIKTISYEEAYLFCAMTGSLRNGAVWGMVRRGEAPLWDDRITQVVGLEVPLPD